MPSQQVIERFLSQKHLAFVGVSRDPKQFANSVYRRLREDGRSMYPVNQHADVIEGDQPPDKHATLPTRVQTTRPATASRNPGCHGYQGC